MPVTRGFRLYGKGGARLHSRAEFRPRSDAIRKDQGRLHIYRYP